MFKQLFLQLICLIKGHKFNRPVVDDNLEFCQRCRKKEILDRTLAGLEAQEHHELYDIREDWN